MLHIHPLAPFFARQCASRSACRSLPLMRRITVIAASFGPPETNRRSTTLSRAATVSHSPGADPDRPRVVEDGVDQRAGDLGLINLARPDDVGAASAARTALPAFGLLELLHAPHHAAPHRREFDVEHDAVIVEPESARPRHPREHHHVGGVRRLQPLIEHLRARIAPRSRAPLRTRRSAGAPASAPTSRRPPIARASARRPRTRPTTRRRRSAR